MPIDRFDRARFEAALPVANGSPLWKRAGLQDGELCYCVPITANPGVAIFVRSTMAADGVAADTAEDSIRCWLVSDPDGHVLSAKAARWIARTNGWDRRLIETLRLLWRIGAQLGVCKRCGQRLHALRVRKDGPNKGRWFSACMRCSTTGGGFIFERWLRTEPKPKPCPSCGGGDLRSKCEVCHATGVAKEVTRATA